MTMYQFLGNQIQHRKIMMIMSLMIGSTYDYVPVFREPNTTQEDNDDYVLHGRSYLRF